MPVNRHDSSQLADARSETTCAGQGEARDSERAGDSDERDAARRPEARSEPGESGAVATIGDEDERERSSSFEEIAGDDDDEVTDGRASRAQRRRRQRRDAILRAAKRVFREKGYHAASTRDIIDAAAIARGTFYLYFQNRRELLAELCESFLERIRGSVRRISLDPADGEPLEQMRANFRRVMAVVVEDSDLADIMLRDPASFDPETRAQVELFLDQVVALIERAVEVGHALGIARRCDRHIIAVSALGALREILRRMLEARRAAAIDAAPARDRPASSTSATPGPTRPSAALTDIEAVADELLAFFVQGVFT